MLTLVLGFTLWTQERLVVKGAILMVRNFYGSIRVTQDGQLQDPYATRTLVNGTITHGLQYLAADRRRLPTTYYGHQSGVGLAIENTRHSTQRVGVIGLGAGTIAAYGRPGDYYRFYDINPLRHRNRPPAVHLSGGLPGQSGYRASAMHGSRWSAKPSQKFDVLAVDAFSSDSIPVHLLTVEAFRLFFRHLRPDGILAVHVSNSHLNLEPVVERLATALGKQNILVDTDDARRPGVRRKLGFGHQPARMFSGNRPWPPRATPSTPKRGLRTWTDDYSNLIQILE